MFQVHVNGTATTNLIKVSLVLFTELNRSFNNYTIYWYSFNCANHLIKYNMMFNDKKENVFIFISLLKFIFLFHPFCGYRLLYFRKYWMKSKFVASSINGVFIGWNETVLIEHYNWLRVDRLGANFCCRKRTFIRGKKGRISSFFTVIH